MLKGFFKHLPAPRCLGIYSDHPVDDRLFFAEKRLRDLQTLNGGNLAGATHRERQPLIQEFFFHVSGAIDFLAQEINIKRSMGLLERKVKPFLVAKALAVSDPLRQELLELHPETTGPMPTDPYSEAGSHFRIVLFRNFVTHIRHNPFLFRVGSLPSASLRLDPRQPVDDLGRNASTRPVFEELEDFHQLVLKKCRSALSRL